LEEVYTNRRWSRVSGWVDVNDSKADAQRPMFQVSPYGVLIVKTSWTRATMRPKAVTACCLDLESTAQVRTPSTDQIDPSESNGPIVFMIRLL
jgi:hypothetical protein